MNDGTLLGCVLFDKHEFGAGSVFEERLKDIWYNSKKFEEIRNFKTTDSACASCSFSYFCNGGCPALNRKKEGRIDA
ncbi:SPASM domain-containing protein, partial [Micrococcus sp. SIMBA_144]